MVSHGCTDSRAEPALSRKPFPCVGRRVHDRPLPPDWRSLLILAVIIFLPVVLAYTAWVFRVLRGRITLEAIREQTGLY